METKANPQPTNTPQQPPASPPNLPETPEPYSTPQTLPPNEQLTPAQPGMFKGRLNRIGFLMAGVYIFILLVIPVGIALISRGSSGTRTITNIIVVLWGIFGFLFAVPVGISAGIRRWHDLNKSGFLVLLNLIPIVGWMTFLIQLLFPGTKGSNNYGSEDNRPSTPKKVLLGK